MLRFTLAAAALVAVAAPPAHAQQTGVSSGVSLTIRDGRVTLRAENAALRQILAEWERQGQMKVVGADKLAPQVVTLSLTDMPEKQALEIVMRGVPGYMAIDRATADAPPAPSASRFDRLVVMARTTTPVATVAAAPTRARTAQPAPAQPAGFPPQPEAFVQPAIGDDGMVSQQPDRSDVEQFTQTEPPMPEAPVASPYPNSFPGSPYAAAAAGMPYGGAAPAAAAAGVAGPPPPETQFDYANPQRYFEQRRQQMQGPTATPSVAPAAGAPIGTTGRPVNTPTAVPTVPGTAARPGLAPTPQAQPTPAQGEFFNPYNLPPDWVPPPAVPNSGTPVEPDRSKYANPYEQKPPQE
jgi:hypothetical protein